jgi:hypothetical protein
MTTKFQWSTPAIPEAERTEIEALVTSTLKNIAYLESERRVVLIQFVPDSPASDMLVATVEVEHSRKLLAVIEARRHDAKIKIVPLNFGGLI